MRLPIDTTSIKFAVAGPAEPVIDFATKLRRSMTTDFPFTRFPCSWLGLALRTPSRSKSQAR